MLYKGTNKLKAFKGDYAPVNIYKGHEKITGWEYQTKSGEGLLFDNTYNDSASVKIFGKTDEVGTGVKGSDNPYQLNSVSSFDLVCSDGAEQVQTVPMPYTLRSLPDDAKDYIEVDNVARTARLYRLVGEYVLGGGEEVDVWNTYVVTHRCVCYPVGLKIAPVKCTHLNYDIGWQDSPHAQIINQNGLNQLGLYLPKNIIAVSDDAPFAEKTAAVNAWLVEQYNSGTPLIVQYELENPEIIPLDYEEIKTFYPQTQIYTAATIQPTIEATLKTAEGA